MATPMSCRLCDVRLVGDETLVDVDVRAGVISAITPRRAQPTPVAEDVTLVDGGGGLLLPLLVDPHLHLDLAHSLDIVPANRSGTLLEAIALWSEAKRGMTAESVCARALRALHEVAAHGVGFVRSHVDVGSAAGLRLAEGVIEARQQVAGLVQVELVAFPQDGLLRDPAAVQQVRDAVALGVDLVGGIPHVERTAHESIAHIRLMLDLAESLDRPVDVHIDETDDPDSRCVETLASEVIQRGLQGRVTASHVCALSSYPEVHARKVMALMAEAQLTVVTNPQVNLHLQGRFDRHPKRRGLTRVKELISHGVTVAAGQDCIRDPFYPLGTGNMVDVAHTLAHAEHLSSDAELLQALSCVTSDAAKALRLPAYGVAVGKPANLALFPTPTAHETLRLRPRPIKLLRASLAPPHEPGA